MQLFYYYLLNIDFFFFKFATFSDNLYAVLLQLVKNSFNTTFLLTVGTGEGNL